MVKVLKFLVGCIPLFYSFYSSFSFLEAAPSFLADKHNAAGIVCGGCHKENPPKEWVPTAVCIKCHGDQAKVAERTQKVIPNPHESHLGNVKCELCHHAHKPSQDHCSNCHEFDYKVP
jgi:uncharacterized CHY-type Zn-finger protein